MPYTHSSLPDASMLSIIIINEKATIHYHQESPFGQFVAVKLSPVLQQRACK